MRGSTSRDLSLPFGLGIRGSEAQKGQFGRSLGCVFGGSLDGLRLHASAPVGLTGEGYAQVSFGPGGKVVAHAFAVQTVGRV